MLIRKTLYAFLTPPNIFFILLLLVWLFYYKRWARKTLIYTTLVFILLSTPFIANRLHGFLNAYPALSTQQIKNSRAQAIVLLSGGRYGFNDEFERNMPNADTILRSVYAARITRQTKLPLLVSGGGQSESDKMSEAAIIQNFLQIELNTPARWLETQSNNTLENALYTKALLSNFSINKIILVTQSWHMKRAVAVFEQQGFEVLAAPTFASRPSYRFSWLDDLVPSSNAFRRSQTALHEIAGIIWYKFEALSTVKK